MSYREQDKWENLRKRLYEHGDRGPPHKKKISKLLILAREGMRAKKHRDRFVEEKSSSPQLYHIARDFAEDRGYLTTEKKGRKKIIQTTPEGEKKIIEWTPLEEDNSELELEVYLDEEPGTVRFKLDSDDISKKERIRILLNYYREDFSPPNYPGQTVRQFLNSLHLFKPWIVKQKIDGAPFNETILAAYSEMFSYFDRIGELPWIRKEPAPLVTPDMYRTRLVSVPKKHLFSLDEPEMIEDLNQGSIPEKLEDRFVSEGYHLSRIASLSVEENNKKWKIDDNGFTYILEKENDKVEIYGRDKRAFQPGVRFPYTDEFANEKEAELPDFEYWWTSEEWMEKYREHWKENLEDAVEEISLDEFWKKGEVEFGDDLRGAVAKWECLDFSERNELEVEKYVPEKLVELVERPSVRNWISDRLCEYPSFFMPWPFWEVLGFQEETKDAPQDATIVHPYCAKLVKPRFGDFYFELKTSFSLARDTWQKGEKEKAFGYVYPAIRDYSERNGFYEAWRFLREEPKGSVLTDMKDFKLFKPLDEAFFRRIEFEEKDVLITSVYRHLWRGVPIEKVLEMMREGKYDSPPSETKTEVSSEFGSLPL